MTKYDIFIYFWTVFTFAYLCKQRDKTSHMRERERESTGSMIHGPLHLSQRVV